VQKLISWARILRFSRLAIRGDYLARASGQDAERALLTVAALFGQEALQFESFGERRHAPVIGPVADGASNDAEPDPPSGISHALKAIIVYNLDNERQLRPYQIQVVMKPDFDLVFHQTGWEKAYGK
jgi:hypothetical protein